MVIECINTYSEEEWDTSQRSRVRPRIFKYDGFWCVDWGGDIGQHPYEEVVVPTVRWVWQQNGWIP